ncbi:Arrestin [Spraguea lophii 42_110]|uniref:Arrestin n=1 Tax=Spraguea lophii (strain 42_110) TaxID=1358809 RepID=S7W7B8_SPRLO|nr:Arrestin [Spraguea lophii 42_110]
MEKNIYITFDRRFYSSQDVINGIVHLETKIPMKVDYIEIIITKKYYAECTKSGICGLGEEVFVENKTLYVYKEKIFGYNHISSGHHTFPFSFTVKKNDSSTVRLNKKYKNKYFKVFNGYMVECRLKENNKNSFDILWNENSNVKEDEEINDIVNNVLSVKNTINCDENKGRNTKEKIFFEDTTVFKANDEEEGCMSPCVNNTNTQELSPFSKDSYFLKPRYFQNSSQQDILEYKEYLDIFDISDIDILSQQRLNVSMCFCLFSTKIDCTTVTNKKLYFTTENILLLTKISPKCKIMIQNLTVTLIQLFSIKIKENTHSFTKLVVREDFSKNMGNGNWQSKIKIPRSIPSTVDEEYLKINYFLKIDVIFNRSTPVVLNKKVDIFNRELNRKSIMRLDVKDAMEYPAIFFTLD